MAKKINNPLMFQFFTEIGIIEQLARAHFESVLPDGLKISQFSVLNHLVRIGDHQSPMHLAKAFQVTKGAMTNTVQRLESRGLVKVVADPSDGRGKHICLTATGRAMREECIRNIEPYMNELKDSLGKKSFANALPFLQQIRQTLDIKRN
jgi:DNA-binding MarR family transcriptional regulator